MGAADFSTNSARSFEREAKELAMMISPDSRVN
jgi:hypothetical protein